MTNPNGTNQTNWEGEAKFWKTKYFEQMSHSAQVIAALSREYLLQEALAQLMGQGAAGALGDLARQAEQQPKETQTQEQ